MSKRRKLIINIILISILILLALVSTLLYINLYPRVSVHLISDNELLDTIEIKKNSSIPALKSPEKEGYTFDGWYNDQDYTSPFVYGENLSEDVELYAKFTAIDYTLTFNYGDIANIYPSAIYHFYDAVLLPDGSETVLIQGKETTLATLKQGYEFAGWAPTKNSTIATYGKGTTFLMPSSNVNLYAVWEPIAYSVKYYIQDLNQIDAVRDVDSDGFVAYNANSHVKYAEIEYKYNTKITSPDAPQNEQGYYQFVGWYEDPEFTKPINFNQTYMGLNQLSNINLVPIYDTDNEDDICLYGKWQVVRFNIAFSLNSSSRVGTKYVVKDSSVMQTDENGSYTNSDFFKYKEDIYFGLPLSYLDGGIYSSSLLDGQVYYSYGTMKDTVSHKFVGWYTAKSASEGIQYKNDTQFNPEDFPEYYTNRDEGFSFLEPGVRTYVLYAVWEEFLHIEYSYNGSILDRQQVENGKTGQLNDPAKMPNVKRSGYHFIGWSKTSDAVNTGATIYKLGQNYKFTTEASESENENCLFFSVGNRKTTLYPIFKPNNYEIKYDFSINTLGSDGKLNIIKPTQPNNIEFSDYLNEKLAETFIVRYNTTVNGRLESHTVLNSIDTNGNSNATYKDTNGETYLLLSWAVVDEDNNVVATYNGNNEIYANSTNSVIYKYSKEKSNGNYELTIKAVWTTQMTINFDKGWDDVEGSVPEAITGMTGATIKLPTTPNLTRPYHVFRGWVVDDERVDENGKENYNPASFYLSNNSYSFSENTTLYALWEPIEYRLIVRNTTVNGNEGAQIASISIGAGLYKNLVAQVTVGENIVIGEGATATVVAISSPQAGYSLTGFSITAGGDVVFENGDVITILSKANENNIFNPFPASNAKTFTIYAKYEIITYDIEIDKDGDGTYETIEEEVTHGALLRDNMPNPSLAQGYEINYWEVDNGSETIKIENMNASDFKVTSNLKVKLYTKIQTFTVLIQQTDPVSGNIVDEIKKEGVQYNSTLQLDPTDDDYDTYFGYIFDGWYLGETKVDLSTQVITSNVTYKTRYVADKVRFVYHANKDADDTTITNSSIFDYGTEVTLPTQVILGSGFTKEGYVLSGWTLDADNTEVIGATNSSIKVSTTNFDDSLFVTIDGQTGYFIHIYAQYSRQFTVSFEFPENIIVTGNTSIVEKYIAGSEINIASFIKNNGISITPHAGYVFNNDWYVKGYEDTLYNEYEINTIVVNNNIVLMPLIQPIKYTAIFNYKYPSQSTYTTLEDYTQEDIEIDNVDTKINLPSADMLKDILKNGSTTYRALSWYLQGAGGTYELGQSITLTSDMISAGNTVIEFTLNLNAEKTLRYNPDDPDLTSIDIKVVDNETIFVGYRGEATAENLITFAREGYNLVSWIAGDTEYAIADELVIGRDILVEDGRPFTFKAVWEKKQTNIIYNSNYPVSQLTNITESSTVDWDTNYSVESKDWNCETADYFYVISAWNTQSNGSGTTYNVGETIKITLEMEGDFNLYAVWKRAYRVVYKDGANQENGTEHLLVGEEYTFVKTTDVSFTKEGHYIAKWSYGGNEYEPSTDLNPSKAVVLTNDVPGKTIVFEAVWAADELTITFVYTNADNSEYSRTTYDTSYGATYTHDFDMDRENLTYDGHNYIFVAFVDDRGNQYTLNAANKIVVEQITYSMTLTTLYQKEVTLTYVYASGTEVLTFAAGTIIGNEENPFLTFTDQEMSDNGEGNTKHIGWNDGTNNYTFITNASESGYNYVTQNSFASTLTLNNSVVVNIVKLDKYELLIYDDISYDVAESKVEFSSSNSVITLVEGDTYLYNYNNSDYKGFVIGGSVFSYDPSTEKDLDANDTFVLTNALVANYASDKKVYLYPLQYINVTFVGLNSTETTKTILAGTTASPDAVASGDEKSYFSHWVVEGTGETIDFANDIPIFWEDTRVIAVYKNFFSVQYLDGDIPNRDALNSTKLKDTDKVNLAQVYNTVEVNGETIQVNYVKPNMELIGWYICYSPNGLGNDYDNTLFALGAEFYPYEYAEAKGLYDENGNIWTNFYIFPVWEAALLDITFSNSDLTEFSLDASGTYKVEYNSDIVVQNVSDIVMTIKFTAVEVQGDNTRKYTETTVTATALQVSANNILTKWQFTYGDSNTIDIDNTFKFTEGGNISFTYTTSAVNITVGVKYAGEIQSDDTYGYFYKGTNKTKHLVTYTEKGTSGAYDLKLTAAEQTSTVAQFNGWFVYDENTGEYVEIENDSIFTVTGEVLNITGLKDNVVIYADFSAGYVTVNQTNSYLHIKGKTVDTSKITSLKASFENVDEVDGVEYTSGEITIDGTKALSVNLNDTVTISYNFTSGAYRIYGIRVSYTLVGDTTTTNYIDEDGDGIISFVVSQVVPYTIQMIVVESEIKVHFKGFDGVTDLFTKTYQYGATLGEIGIPSENGKDNDYTEGGKLYTFAGWNSIDQNTIVSSDMDIMSSWIRVYDVVVSNGNSDTTHKIIYTSSDTETTSLSGEYKNLISLTAVNRENYRLVKYVFTYEIDENLVIDLSGNVFILNDVLSQAEVEQTVSMRIDPVYEKLYGIRVYTKDGSVRDSIDQTSIHETINYTVVEEEGYDFVNWTVAYNGKTQTIPSLENFKLQDLSILDESNVHLVEFTPIYQLKSFTVSFVVNNTSRGSINASNEGYEVNYGEKITFSAKTATFVDSLDMPQVITATTIGAYQFLGYSTNNSESIEALGEHIITGDVVIYAIFVNATVGVTAQLHTYVDGTERTDMDGGWIVQILELEEIPATSWNLTVSTGTTIRFNISSEIGFNLTSVEVKVGDGEYQTLEADGMIYTLTITDVTDIQIRFDAIEYDVTIAMGSVTGFTETPWAYYMDEEDNPVSITTTRANVYEDIAYSLEKTLIVFAEEDYYDIDKIVYTLGTSTTENDIADITINADGKYEIKIVVTNDVHIKVYVKFREVQAVFHDYHGNLTGKTKAFTYNQTISGVDVSDSTYKLANYYYNASGTQVPVASSAVGGYKQTGWYYLDEDDNHIPFNTVSDRYTLDGDLHLYPLYDDIYFVKTTIANTYVSGGYTNNEEVIDNLFSLYVPSTLIKGYVFLGYECKIGESYVSLMYNGASWSVKFASFDSAQTTTLLQAVSGGKYSFDVFKRSGWTSYTQFTLEAKFRYESYTLHFDITTGSTLGEGKIYVDGVENTRYDLAVEYGYTIQYDKKSVATYSVVCFVVTVYNRDNQEVKTLYYVPNDACVVNKMEYQLSGGSKTTFTEDTPLTITANTTFTGTFGNATASVIFKFTADSNLSVYNLPIVMIMLENSGISGEAIATILKYNHTIANPEYIEGRPVYTNGLTLSEVNSFAFRVDIPRTQSFKYTLSAHQDYDIYGSKASSGTIQVNSNMEFVFTLKLKTKTISFQNNFYNGTENTPSTQKGYVILHYKEAVENLEGIITSFTDKTMGVAGTNSYEVMIYHTDTPYFEVVESTGYQLQGVYESEYDEDGDNTEVAPYNAASARYVLDLHYDTFCATFIEKEVTFTFAISNGTKNLVVATKTYKVTDVSKFENDVKNLNTATENTYTLNELLMLNANKVDFKNVWVDTKSATGVWDTTNAYLNAGMLNLNPNVIIYANVVTAHLVEVKAGANGSISYDSDDENHGETWLLYSNTARGDDYSNLQFKVRVENGIPTITAKPDAGYTTDFQFNAIDDKYKNVYNTLTGSEALTVDFYEIMIEISVEIVDVEENSNIVLNGSALSLNNFEMGSTTTFDELYDKIIELLTSKYGRATDYTINGNNHYIFYSNTNISYYLSLEVSKLYDTSLTILNFDDAIYTKSGNSDQFTVCVRFGRVDKYEFVIQNLATQLTKLYLHAGDTVNLATILYPGTEYTLLEYASEHNFGLTGEYYSHLSEEGSSATKYAEFLYDPNTSRYLERMSVSDGERTLNTSIKNTTFTMEDADVVLYVVAAKELSLKITLSGDTTSADEELEKNNIQPKVTQINPAPTYFEGKRITQSEVFATIQNYFNSSSMTMFEILGIGDKDYFEENLEIVVNESTASSIINVVVRISRMKTTVNLASRNDWSINIPVVIEYDENYKNPGYFSTATSDPYYQSAMPFVFKDGEWVQNPLLTSEEMAVWMPEGYTFIGYLIVEEGYIIGTKSGNYIEAMGEEYTIYEYNLTSFRNGVINPEIEYNIEAIYYSSHTLNFNRSVNNYVDNIKSTQENMYSNYGYAYEITYKKWTVSAGNYVQTEETLTVYSIDSVNQISASLDDVIFKVIYADYYTVSIPSYTGGTSEEKSISDIDINGGLFKCITFTLSPNAPTGNVTVGMRADYTTSILSVDTAMYTTYYKIFDISGNTLSSGILTPTNSHSNTSVTPIGIDYKVEITGFDYGPRTFDYIEYYHDPVYYKDGSRDWNSTSASLIASYEPFSDVIFSNIKIADGSSVQSAQDTIVAGRYLNVTSRKVNFNLMSIGQPLKVKFQHNSEDLVSPIETGAVFLTDANTGNRVQIYYKGVVYDLDTKVLDNIIVDCYDRYASDHDFISADYTLNSVNYNSKTSNTTPSGMTTSGIEWSTFQEYNEANTLVFKDNGGLGSISTYITFNYSTGIAKYSFVIEKLASDFDIKQQDITCSDTGKIDGNDIVKIDFVEESHRKYFVVSGFYRHLSRLEILATTDNKIKLDFYTLNSTSPSKTVYLTLSYALSIKSNQSLTIDLITKWQGSDAGVNSCDDPIIFVDINVAQINIYPRLLSSTGEFVKLDDNSTERTIATIRTRADEIDEIDYSNVINFQNNEIFSAPIKGGLSTLYNIEGVENIDYFNLTSFLNSINSQTNVKIVAETSFANWYKVVNGVALWQFNLASYNPYLEANNSLIAGEQWYTLRGLMFGDYTEINTYGYQISSAGAIIASGDRIQKTSTVGAGLLDENNYSMYLVIDENVIYDYKIDESVFGHYTKTNGYTLSGDYDMPYLLYWDKGEQFVVVIDSSSNSFENVYNRFPTNISATTALGEVRNNITSVTWGVGTSPLTVKGDFASYTINTSSQKGLSYISGHSFSIRLIQATKTVAYLGMSIYNYGNTYSYTSDLGGIIESSKAELIKNEIEAGTILYEVTLAGNYISTPSVADTKDPKVAKNYQLTGNEIRYWTNTNLYTNSLSSISLVSPGVTLPLRGAGDKELQVMFGVYAPSGDNYTYNSTSMWSFDSSSKGELTGYNMVEGNTSLQKFFNSNLSETLYVPRWHFMKDRNTELTFEEDDQAVATYAYEIDWLSIINHGLDTGYFDSMTHNPGDIKHVYYSAMTYIDNPGVYAEYGSNTYGYTKSVEELIANYPMISKLTWTHAGAYSLESYNTYSNTANDSTAITAVGSYLWDAGDARIVHVAPNSSTLYSSLSYNYIDAMAFAYYQGKIEKVTFNNIKAIGSGAFYESSDDFASEEITFGSNLEYVGVQLFQGRGRDNTKPFKITFYGKAPLKANGDFESGLHNDSLFVQGYPVLMDATIYAPNVLIYYYAQFDYTNYGYNFDAFRYDGTSAYFFLAEGYVYDKYRFIEAPAEYFDIVNGSIQGINSTGLSRIPSSSFYKYLVLPSVDVDGNPITRVDYIGTVDVGYANNRLGLITIYVQGSHDIGSLYHGPRVTTTETTRAIDMGHGVQHIEMAINTFDNKEHTLGDGKFFAFDPVQLNSSETSLISVNLPHITRVLGVSDTSTRNSDETNRPNTLQYLHLPNVTSIGNNAFYKFTSLREAYISKVTTIEAEAFRYCSLLQGVDSPNLSRIGDYAFAQCTSLTSLGMSDGSGKGGASAIGSHFAEGTKLTSVKIDTYAILAGTNPQNAVPNAADAFYGMDYLTKFYVYDTMLDGALVTGPEAGVCLYSRNFDKNNIVDQNNILMWKSFISGSSYNEWLIKVANGVTSLGTENWIESDGIIYDRAFEGSKLTSVKFNSIASYSGMYFGYKVFNESSIQKIETAQIIDAMNVTNLYSLSYLSIPTGSLHERVTISNEGNYTLQGASALTSIEYADANNNGVKLNKHETDNPSIWELYDGCVYSPKNNGSTGNNYYKFVFAPEAHGDVYVNMNTYAICAEALTNNTACTEFMIQNTLTDNVSEKAFYKAKALRSISVTSSPTYNQKYKYVSYGGVLYEQKEISVPKYDYTVTGYCTNLSCVNYTQVKEMLHNGSYYISSTTKYDSDTSISKTIFKDYKFTCSNCGTIVINSGAGLVVVQKQSNLTTIYERTLKCCPPAKTGSYDMRNMTSTSFESVVAAIGPYAFYNTQLTSLYINKDVGDISKDNAFTGVANNLTIWMYKLPVDDAYAYFTSNVTVGLVASVYQQVNPYITNNTILFSSLSTSKAQIYGFLDESYGGSVPYDQSNQLYKFTSLTYGSTNSKLGYNDAAYQCYGCGMYYWGYVENIYSDANLLVGTITDAYYVLGNAIYDEIYYCRNCTFKNSVRYSTYNNGVSGSATSNRLFVGARYFSNYLPS